MEPTSSAQPPERSREELVGELLRQGTGTRLGRHTLVRRIATGGMAEVYVARSGGISGFEKRVAIKKILPQYSLNPRFVDMLVDEAKITVSLTHPNIAQVYELGLEDETYYIVMEHVDGRPLHRLIQRLDQRGQTSVPPEHAIHVVAEVAKGLYHAHTQRDAQGRPLGIIHRDVSPQNILIAYSGEVKLIDFGIARAEGRANQTRAGVIKGKLRYLAPEIARGEEPDARADVYCSGIVLFELLTGEAMFAPRTDAEAIEMASEGLVRSPRSVRPELDAELDRIVMRALERDRDKRYASAKELYAELRRYANQRYPAYLGSELGELMQDLFAPEIAEERRLDRVADELILAGEVAAEGEGDATEAEDDGYRQLVTRSNIELFPSRPTSLEAPLPSGVSPDNAPTVIDMGRVPDLSAPPPARGLRGPAFTAILVAVSLALFWLSFVVFSGGGRVGPAEPPPIPPMAETATVRLVTEPVGLAVDVRIDGELLAKAAFTPFDLAGVAAGREVKLEVSAEGHEPVTELRRLEPGASVEVTIVFRPKQGELVLVGLEPTDVVVTDLGRVEGDRVVDLPLGRAATVRVERIGHRPFVTTVEVEDARPVEVVVPEPVARAPGFVRVTARPNATVYAGKRALGTTPLRVPLAPGTHRLVLKAPGGKTHAYTVTVRSGQDTTIRHRW